MDNAKLIDRIVEDYLNKAEGIDKPPRAAGIRRVILAALDATGREIREKVKVCAVKNCARGLSALNTSGVCRQHNHRPGYCKCPKCAMIAAKDG